MANLYFKVGIDNAWENPLNWWLDAAATSQALNSPWADAVDTTYLAYDLTLANGEEGYPQMDYYFTETLQFGTGATGTCDIYYISNFASSIHGGTWTGGISIATAYITGGTFTGNIGGFYSSISGGTFTGGVSGPMSIHDGTFTGNVTCDFLIDGGTFTGSVTNNAIDPENTFYGIHGGTFSGSDFINNGRIDGGTFIYPAVNVSDDGVNTSLSISGSGSSVVFVYPTPPSGGGDQTIARLLNLPWFINL